MGTPADPRRLPRSISPSRRRDPSLTNPGPCIVTTTDGSTIRGPIRFVVSSTTKRLHLRVGTNGDQQTIPLTLISSIARDPS